MCSLRQNWTLCTLASENQMMKRPRPLFRHDLLTNRFNKSSHWALRDAKSNRPKEYQNLYCCCCLVVRRAHGRGDAKLTGRGRGDVLIFRHFAVRIGSVVDRNTRSAACCGATKKYVSINRGSTRINARQKSEHTRSRRYRAKLTLFAGAYRQAWRACASRESNPQSRRRSCWRQQNIKICWRIRQNCAAQNTPTPRLPTWQSLKPDSRTARVHG